MIAFLIGVDDAKLFQRQFSSHLTADDLMNILKYHAYSRLLINGMPSRPFSIRTKLIDELKNSPPSNNLRDSCGGSVVHFPHEYYQLSRSHVAACYRGDVS